MNLSFRIHEFICNVCDSGLDNEIVKNNTLYYFHVFCIRVEFVFNIYIVSKLLMMGSFFHLIPSVGSLK